MMPSEIVKKVFGKTSNTYFNVVSRALAELESAGLIKCLNPKEKTGRFYHLTQERPGYPQKALTKTATFIYSHILYIFTHNLLEVTNMVTVTLAVPSDLKHKMETFPEINWSEIARQAFTQKIQDLEFLRKFREKSTLTEEDAIQLGRELNKNLAKRRLSS